jgi:hypothetical protein
MYDKLKQKTVGMVEPVRGSRGRHESDAASHDRYSVVGYSTRSLGHPSFPSFVAPRSNTAFPISSKIAQSLPSSLHENDLPARSTTSHSDRISGSLFVI